MTGGGALTGKFGGGTLTGKFGGEAPTGKFGGEAPTGKSRIRSLRSLLMGDGECVHASVLYLSVMITTVTGVPLARYSAGREL